MLNLGISSSQQPSGPPPPPPPPPTPLLDLYPGAEGAYSFRLLSSSYTGPCIKVQRSSDFTETDIGFGIDGLIDATALIAFVGPNIGRISVWYDQSGGISNDLFWSNPNFSTKSLIALSSNIVKTGNRPSINSYDTSTFGDRFIAQSMLLQNNSLSVYASGKTSVWNSINGFNSVAGSSNYINDFTTFNLFADNKYYFGDGSGVSSIPSSIPSIVQTPYKFVIGAIARASNDREVFTNGVSNGINNTNYAQVGIQPCVPGRYRPFYSNTNQEGIFEIIMYPVGHSSATAIGIHTNMNQYANVY